MGVTQEIDITTAQRKIILDALRSYLPNTTVWVYGSRVKWTARPQSDLDMAVFTTPKQDPQVSNLKEAFEESDLPFRVDLFVWDEVPEKFRKNIEAEHVVLQEKVERVFRGDGFERKTLGPLCFKIGSGATPRGGSKVYLDSGRVALIRSQNVRNDQFKHTGLIFIEQKHADQLSNVMVEENDVLLNITGDSVARCCQVDAQILPARVNQHVAIIRPDQTQLNPKFLRYFLVSSEMQNQMLAWAGSGGTRNALTKGMIEDFEVPVPEINEQRAIAHILGSLDDKIELNRRMNETLEAMAQALFKSWFVDYDPVIDNALAAGKTIPKELKERAELRERLGDACKPLPEEIKKLFPDEFKHTKELGWLPKGWEVKKIGSILELAYGKALAKNKRTHGLYPVYGSGGITGYHHEAIVTGPGIIVGRKGTVGSVYWEESDFFPIDTVFFIKLKKIVPLYWVYENLQRMDILSLGADSAVPGVNRHAVYSKEWTLPSGKILKEFWCKISSFIQKRQEIVSQSESLQILRDTLLPKLLSGELRILEAEKLMETVE